jgi:ribose transport system permease protein
MTTSIGPPDTVPEQRAEPTTGHRLPFWVNQRLGLLALVITLSVLFGVPRPAFLDQRLVLFPLLRDIANLTVVALAQMVALSVGHMNLAGRPDGRLRRDVRGLRLLPSRRPDAGGPAPVPDRR